MRGSRNFRDYIGEILREDESVLGVRTVRSNRSTLVPSRSHQKEVTGKGSREREGRRSKKPKRMAVDSRWTSDIIELQDLGAWWATAS